MGNTSIQWTDKSWNPTRGCSRVSEGCRNCYAERQAARFAAPRVPGRSIASPDGFSSDTPAGPFHGFVQIINGHPQWTGKVELIESKLTEPLFWKKPCRVFVNSMSDLFHEALPDEAIDRVFAVMALCPQHTFQILTKRPKRMLEYMSKDFGAGHRGDVVNRQIERWWKFPLDFPRGRSFPRYCESWPLANVWLGVSVEDQETAGERIPLLLRTPAVIRFVSYEPALGLVDFSAHSIPALFGPKGLHWVIIGGESGPDARPFDIGWARNTIAQCESAGVACFVKQLGTRPCEQRKTGWYDKILADRKGGDWSEWPEDLRVREFPA